MNPKKAIIDGILDIIHKISDNTYQRINWLEKRTSSYEFFEEIICKLFDDYEFTEVLKNHSEYGITEKQFQILQRFYLTLDKFTDEKIHVFSCVDPTQLLQDSEWKEIQSLAKTVLNTFHYTS